MSRFKSRFYIKPPSGIETLTCNASLCEAKLGILDNHKDILKLLLEFIALFLCGTFFGAAVYISIAQHPATMKAGIPIAAKFFPPMYNLAAPMQIVSAIGGALAGLILWLAGGSILWAVGAAVLFFVIPYTLIILKPINDQLLDNSSQRTESETESLLNQWAPRHWVRSIASGLSFALYIWAGISIKNRHRST